MSFSEGLGQLVVLALFTLMAFAMAFQATAFARTYAMVRKAGLGHWACLQYAIMATQGNLTFVVEPGKPVKP